MVLGELRKVLDKLPPEADDYGVQILFWDEDLCLMVGEDVASVSVHESVLTLAGESADIR